MHTLVETCQLHGKSFACDRAEELTRKFGVFAAKTYGFRIADDKGPTAKEDLVLRGVRSSPVYMRDSHDALRDLFGVIESRDRPPGWSHFAINSPTICNRLLAFYKREFDALIDSWNVGQCNLNAASGIYVFRVKWTAGVSVKDAELKFRNYISRVGGIMSLYDLLQCNDPVVGEASLGASTNTSESSKSSEDSFSSQTRQSSEFLSYSDLVVHRVASDLCRGFIELFPNRNDSALLGNLHDSIVRTYLELLQEPACTMRATRLFEVIADEIFVALAHYRPLALLEICSDFGRQKFLKADSSSNLAEYRCFLFSGGMDALSSAIFSCLESFKKIGNGKPVLTSASPDDDYLELSYLVEDYNANNTFMKDTFDAEDGTQTVADVENEQQQAREEDGSGDIAGFIVIANLGPSCPRGAVDPARVVDVIAEHVRTGKPVVCVFDITIELSAEIETVLASVSRLIREREQGNAQSSPIVCLLCKSLQKYATLGLAKVSGGIVYSISSPSSSSPFVASVLESLRVEHDALNWCQTADAQLAAFIMKYASQGESELVKHAVENTCYVNSLWPSGGLGANAHVANLPFLLKAKTGSRWNVNSKTLLMSNVVPLLGLEDRDSFASNQSAFLVMPDCVRLNIGQEPKSRLAEIFYAPGLMLIQQQSAKQVPNKVTPSCIKTQCLSEFNSDHADRLQHVGSLLRFGLKLFPLQDCLELVEPLELLLLNAETPFPGTAETLCELVLGLLGCYLLFGRVIGAHWEKVISASVPPYKIIQLQLSLSGASANTSNRNDLTLQYDALIRVGLNSCLKSNRFRCLELFLNQGGSLLDFVGHYLSSELCSLSGETSEHEKLYKIIRARFEEATAEMNRKREQELERLNYYRKIAITICEKSVDSTVELTTFCSFVFGIIEREGCDAEFASLLRQALQASSDDSSNNLSSLVGSGRSPLIVALCQKPLALKCRSASMLESILSSVWEFRFGEEK